MFWSTDLINPDIALAAKWPLQVERPGNKHHAVLQTTHTSAKHMCNGVLKVILGRTIPLAILCCRWWVCVGHLGAL